MPRNTHQPSRRRAGKKQHNWIDNNGKGRKCDKPGCHAVWMGDGSAPRTSCPTRQSRTVRE